MEARTMNRLSLLALVVLAWPTSAQTVTTAQYTLTLAQITSCNTAPITLLPSVAGTGYLPVRALGTRTGTRYATQAGDIVVRYAPPTPGVHMRLDLASGGLLTQRRAWLGFAPNAGRYGADDANSADIGGKAVELFCATGNPTVDATNTGSDVTLTLVYESWATPNP